MSAISFDAETPGCAANVFCARNRLLEIASARRCSSSERYLLRELMARPSASRTMGAVMILMGKLRSRTMRRMIAACWASFWPNTARSGSAALKSFETTVVTPSKWIGRDLPQRFLEMVFS